MKLWKHLLERSSCSQHKCFASSHLFTICTDSENDTYLPVLDIHAAFRARPTASGLLSSGNLDGVSALKLSVDCSHKYVAVVEDPAATANSAQHRPFLWTLRLSLHMCTFSTKEAKYREFRTHIQFHLWLKSLFSISYTDDPVYLLYVKSMIVKNLVSSWSESKII